MAKQTLLAGLAAAFMLCVQPAQAIVVIDDFNQPTDGHRVRILDGDEFLSGSKIESGISVFGSSRYLDASGFNDTGLLAIQANYQDSSFLRASADPDATGTLTAIWDGRDSGTGSINGDNLSPVDLRDAGMNTGIVLTDFVTSGQWTMTLQFLAGASDWVSIALNNTNFSQFASGSDLFIPFTDFVLGGGATDQLDVFDGTTAVGVTFSFADTSAAASVQFSSIVAHTPEPTSLAIWGVLGLAMTGGGVWRHRRSRQGRSSGEPAAAL